MNDTIQKDIKDMTPEEIVKQYEGLVKYVIRKYFNVRPGENSGYNYEDLYQEGVYNLLKYYKNYNPEKGSSFPTYICKCIFSRLSMYCYKFTTPFTKPGHIYEGTEAPDTISLNYMLDSGDGDPTELETLIGTEPTYEVNGIVKLVMDNYKSKQAARRWYMFRILDYTLDDIAEMEGITRQAIGQQTKKVDNFIKENWPRYN